MDFCSKLTGRLLKSVKNTGILILLVTCLFSFNYSYSLAKVSVTNDFSYIYNNITGAGKDKSSLTDGHRYLNILNIAGKGDFKEYDYYFNIGAQFTDDRNIDPQTFLFTNLNAGITGRKHSINLGDTFREFSRYSLSTLIKGGSYSFSREEPGFPRFDFIYGYAKPRWDFFSEFGEDQADILKRKVTGGKISYSFLNDLKAGFSVVNTDDSERIYSTDELYDIISYSLNWEYKPISNLSITGESSFADTTLSASADVSDIEMEGYAHILTAMGVIGPSRVTFQYERISPDYRTVVGDGISDREKAKIKWSYEFNEKNTIISGFLWYRDNLDGETDIRSDYYKPEINLITKNLFGRASASSGISYKLYIKEKDKTVTSRVDHIVNLNYKDRFGLFNSNSNFGFASYDNRDDPKEKNLEYTYNTSINVIFDRDSIIFKPNLRLGGWTSRRELSGISDKIYEYSLGASIEIPSAKITSNIMFGKNKLEKESDTNSMKSFARLNIYYRSNILSGPQYGTIFLKAFINDYNFDIADSNFREKSVATGVNIKF